MILVLFAYTEIPLNNAHTGASNKIRGLNFGLSIRLHPSCPMFTLCSMRLVGLCLFGCKT